ncbi:MAG TPA: MG2 domain-containing protein, partial [Candidatus Solibacter sp.]|nr:MG2 domain-containing protein [Candidatus Solibacter sp.]
MFRTVVTGLLCVWCAASAPALQVNRSASSIALRGQTTVWLSVQSEESTSGTVRLEWLDPGDAVRRDCTQDVTISAGVKPLGVVCPLPYTGMNESMWYRVRYRIDSSIGDARGVLGIATHSPDAFELRVAAPTSVAVGERTRVTAVATTLATHKPVAGVVITSPMGEGSAVTGADGAAQLEVTPNGAISLEAKLGDFRRVVVVSIAADPSLAMRIDTDKALYQPGQTLHMRFLVRDRAGKPAVERGLHVAIADPHGATAFSSNLRTDRFGVAAVDWEIPQQQATGEYHIRAGGDDRKVRISRYELPNFSVTAAPDKPYYLPGQSAAVDVRAQYLFGKAVPNARVRVTRLNERDSVEGHTDASGVFRAHVNLAELHKQISGEKRYADGTWVAHVTDPTSGRSEDQRFDLRASAEAIHIYVLPEAIAPVHYIATSYADGSPAACKVRITAATGGGTEIATNRFGLARLPEEMTSADMVADDGKGARGHRVYTMWRPVDSIVTDKAIYRAGEAMRVTVRAAENRDGAPAVLDVSANGRPLASRPVRARATVEIPWRQEFAGQVQLTLGVASRTVLFPPAAALIVKAKADKSTYRPGEEASVSFTTVGEHGRAVSASIGVAVVDAAVGQRVQTDAVFGKAASTVAWTEMLPSLPREELERIDFAHEIPPELDLLAEVLLLGGRGAVPHVETGRTLSDSVSRFQGAVNSRLKLVTEVLNSRDVDLPRDEASLRSTLLQHGIDFAGVRDPWENSYRVQFGLEGRQYTIQFVSAGADERFGTGDDIAVPAVRRAWFERYSRAIRDAVNKLPVPPKDDAEVRAMVAGLVPVVDPRGNACAFRMMRDSAGGVRRTRLEFGAGEWRFTAAQWDDFTPVRNRILRVLASIEDFPREENAWRKLLEGAGIVLTRDAHGEEPVASFERRVSPFA